METETTAFLRAHAEMEDAIIRLLGVDTKWIHPIPDSAWSRDGEDTIYTDAWDVPWRKRKGHLYYELDNPPLKGKTHQEILSGNWKPVVSRETAEKTGKEAERFYHDTEYSLSVDLIGAGIFERAWYLRGLEEFVVEMLTEEAFVRKYLSVILDMQLAGYEKILNEAGDYIDTVWITDDVATQDSMIISPDTYRSMIKPLQRELISYIQSRGVEVVFHSCGAVRDLLPDFIEIGVHILHPIQLSATGMDTAELKRDFGRDIVFWGGGIDVETLQFGTPESVRDEVRMRIDHLAKGGGFVFTPTHCIQPNTPPGNILAMAEALRTYGKY